MPIPRWRERLPRAGVLLVILFIVHLAVKIALFPRLANAPLVGDEASYLDSARALSNLVRDLSTFGPVNVSELQRGLAGSGWFMPGISILLTPLFVVDPDASLAMIRGYLGVVSSLLLVLAVQSVRRVLGDLYAGVVLVSPGLVPMWLIFSYTAYGDLCAGLLILLFVMHLIEIIRQLRVGTSPSWQQGVRLGLLATAALYLRSSTSVLIIGMFIVVGAAALLMLRGRERRRGVLHLIVAAVVLVAILLPWSVFASQTLGGRVVTTTSVPIVLANTFGERDRICFGECDPGSTIWFNPLRYSREVARATGISEVEVQKQMSTYARSDVTPHSYASDVLADFGRYTRSPANFAAILRPTAESSGGAVRWFVVAGTDVMSYAMLVVVTGMLLGVFRRSFEAQVISIMLKLGLGALLVQPFVHIAGSRYWTSAAPLAALAVGLLINLLRERHLESGPTAKWWLTSPDTPGREGAVPDIVVGRVLTAVQMVLVAGIVTVAAALLVIAY